MGLEERVMNEHKSLFSGGILSSGSKRPEGTFFTLPFFISGLLLFLIIFCCICAPAFAPYGESEQDLSSSLTPPSAEHLLGADKMGRDLFSRLLYGGRVTLLSALGVVFLSVIIGAPLGLFAGFYGGKFDSIVGRAATCCFLSPHCFWRSFL